MKIRHYVTWNGETHSCAEWSKITGIPTNIISDRRRLGWTVERILTQPIRQNLYGIPSTERVRRLLAGTTQALTLPEMSDQLNISPGYIYILIRKLDIAPCGFAPNRRGRGGAGRPCYRYILRQSHSQGQKDAQ